MRLFILLRVIVFMVFSLWTLTSFAQQKDTLPAKDSIYEKVDTPPEFSAGNEALYRFLAQNIKIAYDCDVISKIYVSMVIRSDSTVSNIKVSFGPTDLNDKEDVCGYKAEVIRIFNMLPTWKPATIKGKAVSCKYLFPIRFETR